MAMVLVDATMVTDFVEDQDAFNRVADELFSSLDTDGDGILSRHELLKGFEGFLMASEGMGMEPMTPRAGVAEQEALFDKFDTDGSGNVDREEFRAEMREIMRAMARGIGESPVHVALDGGQSFLARVVQHGKA